jgi:DNA-binding MarR family transcriptional regulator
MSTLTENTTPDTPDLEARLTNIVRLIEERLKERLDIPKNLNVKQVLILARMVKLGNEIQRMSDLIRLHLYSGSNVHHNITRLIDLGYAESILNEDSDKRLRKVRLTEHGEVLGKEALAELDRIEQGLSEFFPVEKYNEACAFLTAPREELPQELHGVETA